MYESPTHDQSSAHDRPKQILVVDDEPTIRRVVQAYLEREGYKVVTAGDGVAAWEAFNAGGDSRRPDLVILDLMLPGLSGWELCRRMQAADPTVPIIMLTARGEETDRIVGLRLGADDYVSKPFSPAELVARVQAVLRRIEQVRAQGTGNTPVAPTSPTDAAPAPTPALASAPSSTPAAAAGRGTASPADSPELLRFGPLAIDPAGVQAWVDSQPLNLTATEFRLLLMMARHPLRVFTRGQLLEAVAGDSYAGYERNVDTHIKNIRRKLAGAGLNKPPIETVHRVGYRFRPPAIPSEGLL